MTSTSRSLQDNSCGKNSQKLIEYSEFYDVVCQWALLGLEGLEGISSLYAP